MLATLSFAIWLYLFFARANFWRSGPELTYHVPASFPAVDIIVPARDEAATIAEVIDSLQRQDYHGKFRVILVDDHSTDGTAHLVRSRPGVEIISLRDKPPEWSGKLWALQQGVASTDAPLILFTDADIVHDPRHLSSLVAKQQHSDLLMVSEMVRLNCISLAERTLVPAFVYFFQMLYPFQRVNHGPSRTAAAAGGTVLIQRDALMRMGGIDAIKHSLIDDVALAQAVKQYGPIYLGHSGLAASIRPYPRFADLWEMVSRTAFTQLRYSLPVLALTLAALTIVWLVPIAEILAGHGWPRAAASGALFLAMVSYVPTLTRYNQSKFWAVLLPFIALFYMAATIKSAIDFWRGRGARWKSRAYGGAR